MPGAVEAEGTTLEVPPQLKYGIFIGEMSDGGEPIVHIQKGSLFEGQITWGHILRLLLYCVENVRAELMYEKFASKAASQKSKIIDPRDVR